MRAGFVPPARPPLGDWRERAARVAARRKLGETAIRALVGGEIYDRALRSPDRLGADHRLVKKEAAP